MQREFFAFQAVSVTFARMEHAAPGHACLNCAAPLHDAYCARCGQAADTHRFRTAHLLHEIPHSIWHVDKGVLFTLREMLLRPGPAIRNYLAGQRRAYFAPISYLLLLTGLSAFLMAWLHIMPFDMHDPTVSDRGRQLQLHIFGPILKYKSWLEILTLPVTALLTRLLLRRSGFNYAECIIANAFVIGTTVLVTLAFMPLMHHWSGTALVTRAMRGSVITMVLFQARMYGQVLNNTSLSFAGRYFRGLLLSLGNFLLTVLLIGTIIIAANWSSIRPLTQKPAHQPVAPAIVAPGT